MAGVFPHDPDCPEHKKLISIIEDTITGLQELKNDLEGNKGFFKMVSTPNGDDWVSNI
jgi:hypothetical protein